jgi:8-oxo-dGTP pyrophosphatase MutT (NUDIX family)
MDIIEYLDIYDENKNKTGKKKIRYKEPLVDGEFSVGVQATIINSKGEILITQRSADSRVCPLLWECNGGAVLAGEEFLDALVREISEEMGLLLNKEDAVYLKSVKRPHHFKEIYLFKNDIPASDLKFVDGEALEARWVDIETFVKMFEDGEIVPSVDFGKEDYKKCLKILNMK